MSKIYKGIIGLVGNTSLVKVANIEKKEQLKAHLLVKLKYFSLAGGVRSKVGKIMIEDAERTGRLKPGSAVIESTSGNIGIGLAVVSAVKGYRVILIVPDTMSAERRNVLKAYRAEVVLVPGGKGMSNAIEEAEELVKGVPDSFIPDQFDNPVSPRAHMEGTDPEIWQGTDGQVDIFVASVGTGGTPTGTETYLKEENPRTKVTAVEPSTSAVLFEGSTGPRRIQGIGAGFIPKVLDTHVHGEIMTVDSEAPFATTKILARTEGLLTGISSGAALYTGTEAARWPENEGKAIVALLPDNGDRHCSTALLVEQGGRMW